MLFIAKRLPWLVAALILAGCGGGSSQITDPSIIIVPPEATAIGAGTTLQLTATVQDSSNTTVLWFVNSIPGGNGTTGTISPQGLYTAPSVPPQNGSVTISAAPQAFPVTSSSIILNITFANASLQGSYVYTLSGTQSGSPWAVVGSFTADNGTISNGIEDINGPSGVSSALPFSGSYFIDANGQGVATLTSAQGNIDLTFTLNTQGEAVVIRSDAGSVASGVIYPQLPSALTLTDLDAEYVLDLSGVSASGNPLNIIGALVTNGSTTLTYGEQDLNDGGTTAFMHFNGTYSIGSSGRGTATFTDSTGTRTYSFYVVSATQLQFIETDSSGHLVGSVFEQQDVTPTTALTGSYVLDAVGTDGTAAYGAAAGFSINTTVYGQIDGGTGDINSGGSVTTDPTLSGNWTYGANGRGTLTLTGASGSHGYVYYLITPSTGVILTTDSGLNGLGQLFSQSGGFATTDLSGQYTLILSSPVGIAPPTSAVGLLTLNGNGALAGIETINDNGTPSGNLSVTGTYSVTAAGTNTSTRGVATLTTNGGSSIDFAFYPISNSSIILLGESGSPIAGTAVSQY